MPDESPTGVGLAELERELAAMRTERDAAQGERDRVALCLEGAIEQCRETARVLGANDIETSVTAADRVMAHVAALETVLRRLAVEAESHPPERHGAESFAPGAVAGESEQGAGENRPGAAPAVVPMAHEDEDGPRVWRVGRKVPRNLYRGDEPVAMLATSELAAALAEGMNAAALRMPRDR